MVAFIIIKKVTRDGMEGGGGRVSKGGEMVSQVERVHCSSHCAYSLHFLSL